MKKLQFIMPVLFLSFGLNAQQTEDEVYIGKGKTFGNYNGKGIIIPDTDKTTKPNNGQTAITGEVVGICKKDCCNKKLTSCSMEVKTSDGTIILVGTADKAFTVPKEIKGRTIIAEGVTGGDKISGGRKRKEIKKDSQQDIQFAATGIKVIE